MIICMRTTVDLSAEAYQTVRAIAKDRDESMGKVMSDLILKAANRPDPSHGLGEIRLVDGWPVVSIGRQISTEEVREFLAESE